MSLKNKVKVKKIKSMGISPSAPSLSSSVISQKSKDSVSSSQISHKSKKLASIERKKQ